MFQGTFHCICPVGYEGRRCEINLASGVQEVIEEEQELLVSSLNTQLSAVRTDSTQDDVPAHYGK